MGQYRSGGDKKTVAIVGAGPGGLAAAMLMAQRGFDVQVFEKQDVIGGRNAAVRLGDYRFDLGPTFLMMKFLLDELFAEGGRRSGDYLRFKKLDPMYTLNFPDKEMSVRSEPAAMKAEIERRFPGEGANFDRFLERESLRFKKLYPCLQRPYDGLSSMLSPALLAAAPHIAAGRSLYSVLGDYFRSEELRLSFTFQSKYLGMSPWDCPGLFTMISYTEHAHGVYHVMGGLSRITQAFAEVSREEDAEIHTSSPVRRVLVDGRRAVGVELASGEKVYCDDVIINADFGHAMATLFDEKDLGRYPELSGRTQGVLNKQIVRSAHFLIGIFGTRLGTPTGVAPSGTLEEIEEIRKSGKHVALYFSNAPVPRGVDRSQLDALEAYQRSLQEKGVYFQFASIDDLRRLVTNHLPKIVREVQAGLANGNRPTVQPPATFQGPTSRAQSASVPRAPRQGCSSSIS